MTLNAGLKRAAHPKDAGGAEELSKCLPGAHVTAACARIAVDSQDSKDMWSHCAHGRWAKSREPAHVGVVHDVSASRRPIARGVCVCVCVCFFVFCVCVCVCRYGLA